ncbi:MAG: TrkH family potassium uptake protein [Bacteroidales bacterium]|nr:TrkH family potassium uptake protein [Bacteroidales bacterium]
MFNYKIIINILGILLLIEGMFIGISALVDYLYNDGACQEIALSSIITIVFGGLMWFFSKNANKNIDKKEGYIIVTTGWILFSIFGSLPFYLSGAIPSFTDSFFETISGFTTTGASILNDIESMPHGLLFWRSLTQWLGGMGIIVLSVAVLPLLGIGGMQLFVAEVPGLKPDKLHPRIKETAKRLWIIYVAFTFTEMILLLFGGMSLFDAVNHSLTTMATGGYSTKQASIAYWESDYIHWVITIFMFIAGVNFTLSYFALKLNFKKVYQNEEFRYYSGIVLFFVILFAVVLFFNSNLSLSQSFRDSAFQVVSIITTTGFATVDYLQWIPFLVFLMFVFMFFGGSSGSTGGGIKIIRILLLMKNSMLELKRLIHPNAVIPVRFNHKAISPDIISNILAFIVFYVLIFVFGSVFMSALGLDFQSAIGSVIASLGNIGPGIGSVGPAENFSHIPDIGKWFLSFLMLLGRLEIFTVLVIISPAFWRK